MADLFLLVFWVDYTLLIDGASGAIAQAEAPTPSSGLGIGTNIPGGQVMYFLVWKQIFGTGLLEHDCGVL